MSKKKIALKIIQNNNILNVETIGIKKENELKFFLEQKKVTLLINNDNIIMERIIDKEMYIKIIFDKNKPKAICNLNNNTIDMNIEIYTLIIKENYYKVKYKLEEDEFNLEIKVGEI